MAIPNFEQTMLPLLRCIENGKDWEMSEIESWSVKHFGLSKAERTELKPSSEHETLFHNRLHWAKLYLKRADLVVDISRSLVKITKEGLSALKQNPKKIDIKFLKQYSGFLEWYTKKKPKGITEAEEVTLSGYDLDESNAKKIDDYIQKHDCKLKRNRDVIIQGKRVDLDVYRLPLDLLFYNIRNGRFASEYDELKVKEGRELRPEEPADAKKIQKLLFSLNEKESLLLERNIEKIGQTDPGVMTAGGYIINGNRRMAVLQNLVNDGMSNFNFLEAGRLPARVSHVDIWKIEAGIQLSRSAQVKYGPINELLKFQEGILAGLKPLEIAKTLYGAFKEKDILEKLQQLKLITQYLKFIGCPKQYIKAKDLDTHFIDLQKRIEHAEKMGLSSMDITNLKQIGFQLILEGATHKQLRPIDKIIDDVKIREEFWDALGFSKAGKEKEKMAERESARQKDGDTPVRTILADCMDSVKAKEDAGKPVTLLKRALKNLIPIDMKGRALSNPEATTLIGQIDEIVKKLKEINGGGRK